MATVSPQRLRDTLGAVVTAAGYDLEDVSVTAAGRRSVVRVVVDRDGGVDLDAVAAVALTVSEALEAADVMGDGAYVLEVSSPGVDRPLTEPRHWRRAIGRLVQVAIADGGSLAGRIVRADDSTVTIEADGAAHELGYDRLGRGHVQVEFAREATP
jgi:ribosome maturation factor RimP